MARVSFRRGVEFGDRFLRLRGADEHQQRSLAVTPDEVVKQLVESVAGRLRAAPDLALSDEDVPVVGADKDVGLARAVEELATGGALPIRVEVCKEWVSQFFFT